MPRSVIWHRLLRYVLRHEEIANTAILLFLLEDKKMGSKTHKTETVRHRKHAPNKVNRKTDRKVVRENLNVMESVKVENPK